MGKAVKAVTAVAVGVAVGFATGNPYLGVLAGGAMFASSSLTPEVDQGTSTQTELKQVIRSSKEPAHYQFGRCAVGGLLAWAQEEDGDQTKKEWLHLVYVLSEGELEAVDELYLNQEPADDAGSRVEWALVRNPDASDSYLLSNSPDWRDNQIGKGLSFARVSLKYDADYFASGIPTPLFVMRGRRDIYDPRTETTGYSDNWALVILWYLRERLGVPDDEIIWEMFISAANVSDETVTNPDGSSEARYTIGGGFKADTRKDRVLADMEAAGGGQVVRIGGKFGLMAGAYYGPYEMTIDEDMVIGAVSGQTEVTQADAVNTMTGKFIDPDQRWTETDYPAVSVAEWIEQDGGPIEDTLDLQYVVSPYQAQRLANIALRKKRAGGSLSLTLNFRGYACRPGRVVRVYLPSLNIDGEFRVVDWDFHGDSGCKVTLQSEDPEIYDDAVGEPYNPLGFISLPTGGIAAPSGLTYTLESIGETVQGRLDWSAVSGAQSYSVVLRSDGQAVQAIEVPPNSTTCTIGGLPAGQYVAEVRTRGNFGQSGAATVTFSVNAPPMPDRVIVQVTNNEVTLIPQLDWNGTPVSFRFYYSPTMLDANQVRGTAQLLSTGASLVHTGRAYGTTYYYWIDSINAYGHSDLFFQEVETTSDFTEIFDAIQSDIESEGQLYGVVVEGLKPAAVEAADEAVAPFRDELDANTTSIGELQHVDDELTLKMLLLKAGGEASASTLRVEQIVRAGLAQQVTTLAVGQATVEDNLYALWDPDTKSFTSAAIRTVDVNGKKAVLGMMSNGEVAEIGAVADRFYIYNEVSGEMVLAFVVEDGRVVIPEALIGTVNFNKLVSDTGETIISGGKIKTQFLDADTLTVRLANVTGAGVFASKNSVNLSDLSGSGTLSGGSLAGSVSVNGTSLETIRSRANAGDDAYDQMNDWTRTGTTLIDGGKIYADDAFIVSAMIKNLAVGTAQIADGAITINASNNYSGSIDIGLGWTELISQNFDPKGNDLDIVFSGNISASVVNTTTSASAYCRVSVTVRARVDGSTVYSYGTVLKASDSRDRPSSDSSVTAQVDETSPTTLFTRVSGWSGSKSVSIEAQVDVNGTLISASAARRFIKLSSTQK